MLKLNVGAVINACLLLFFAALFAGVLPFQGQAANTLYFSDTITDSAPGNWSNHTFEFEAQIDVPAGAVFNFDFPTDFFVATTADTFDVRNVEMLVNGVSRTASGTVSAGVDGVTITRGAGGDVDYELNPTDTAIVAGDVVTIKIGNDASGSLGIKTETTFSTTTGTTTTVIGGADIEPIQNTIVLGRQVVRMEVSGAAERVSAPFTIHIHNSVTLGPADTTEEDPPERFNGAPSGEIGATSLSIEISVETNEFAWCSFDTASGTDYFAMPTQFDNTGLIVHSHIVSVVLDSVQTYYVRCIDDEGNFNTDDYVITFIVPPEPVGDPNTEDDTTGDGSGTGSSGSGTSDGGGTGGGTSQGGGSSSGGGSSGSSGSGGGSGGGAGDDSESGGAGGFESTNGPYQSGDAQVIINGYAFPGSDVYAVVDGYIAESVRADSNGRYSVTIEAIARGVYTFGIYAVDDNDIQSSVFSTSFTVTGGRTSSLSNINVMPSIEVDPDPVDIGQQLTFSGYSIPDATVTIEYQKDGLALSKKVVTVTSDGNGFWAVDVETGGFDNGTYKVRAESVSLDGEIETDYSDYTFFGVGGEADVQINADLNRDGSVNLTDFSILLFWWGSDGGASDPPADINQDGGVSLTDFSILLFNWTG